MTREEREELIQKNKEANARTLADQFNRREQREFRGETFDEPIIRSEPTIPEPTPVMNAGQRQVQTMHEQNRPTLDPATMVLWDAWFERRFHEMAKPRLKQLARHMAETVGTSVGASMGKHHKELRDQMRKEHADEITKMKREFNSKLSKLRAELALQKGHASGKIVDLPNLLSTSVVIRK